MQEIFTSIPLWGASRADRKIRIGKYSVIISGGSAKFLRAYRLLWAIAKKSSAKKTQSISISMNEGKGLC